MYNRESYNVPEITVLLFCNNKSVRIYSIFFTLTSANFGF